MAGGGNPADVVMGETIEAVWGNQIRDQSVQPFVDATDRDATITAPTAGQLAWLTNPGQVTYYDGTEWKAGGATFPILAPDGSAGAPSYSFATDPDTGLFLAGDGDLRMAVGGGTKMAVQSDQVIPGVSNAIDLGDPSIYWRDVYAGTVRPLTGTTNPVTPSNLYIGQVPLTAGVNAPQQLGVIQPLNTADYFWMFGAFGFFEVSVGSTYTAWDFQLRTQGGGTYSVASVRVSGQDPGGTQLHPVNLTGVSSDVPGASVALELVARRSQTVGTQLISNVGMWAMPLWKK